MTNFLGAKNFKAGFQKTTKICCAEFFVRGFRFIANFKKPFCSRKGLLISEKLHFQNPYKQGVLGCWFFKKMSLERFSSKKPESLRVLQIFKERLICRNFGAQMLPGARG